MQDLDGHLKGGIPIADVDALRSYWTICPSLRKSLFKPNRSGYVDLAVDNSAIKSTIYKHPEFSAFIARMNAHFAEWREKAAKNVRQLKIGAHPKEIIAVLSEDLLTHYTGQPLIDKYDAYQHLMNYWAETMQDDCYIITADGWKAQPSRIVEIDKKGREKDKGWSCDLIPKELIVARYYGAERSLISQLSVDLETAGAKLVELESEHNGEDAAFADMDKVNRAMVTAQLRELRTIMNAEDEIAVLNQWLSLNADEADLRRRLKDAEVDLDSKAYARYATLSEAEVKALIVDDKWLSSVGDLLHSELDRVSQQLTDRLQQLSQRYQTPLPEILQRISALESAIHSHFALLDSKAKSPGPASKWDVHRLGELFKFSGGYSASRDQLSSEGTCYLHYGDIHTSNKAFVNVKAEFQDIPKLDIPLKRISPASFLDDGDVVFVDASEDDEGASKHIVVINPDSIPFISGLHTIVAKGKSDLLDHGYRRYCFQASEVKSQFCFYAVGTKVSGISKTNIAKIVLPVPPKSEQLAISRILSDLDNAIAGLEDKLAKIRSVKQAIMHDLLTGRIRLV